MLFDAVVLDYHSPSMSFLYNIYLYLYHSLLSLIITLSLSPSFSHSLSSLSHHNSLSLTLFLSFTLSLSLSLSPPLSLIHSFFLSLTLFIFLMIPLTMLLSSPDPRSLFLRVAASVSLLLSLGLNLPSHCLTASYGLAHILAALTVTNLELKTKGRCFHLFSFQLQLYVSFIPSFLHILLLLYETPRIQFILSYAFLQFFHHNPIVSR